MTARWVVDEVRPHRDIEITWPPISLFRKNDADPGESIGTPIVGFASRDGDLRTYFGPVITRVPPTEDSVAMFDALTTMIDVQGFWELKRTRTDPPEFPPRP